MTQTHELALSAVSNRDNYTLEPARDCFLHPDPARSRNVYVHSRPLPRDLSWVPPPMQPSSVNCTLVKFAHNVAVESVQSPSHSPVEKVTPLQQSQCQKHTSTHTVYTILLKVFTHPSKSLNSGVPVTSIATGV